MQRIDITIRLELDVDEITEDHRAALEALAWVMLVQAEDGLYRNGNEDSGPALVQVDGRWVDVENEYLEPFAASSVWAIDIEED